MKEKEMLNEIAEMLFPFGDDDSENRIATIRRLSWIDGASWQSKRFFKLHEDWEKHVKENFNPEFSSISFKSYIEYLKS